MRFCRDCGNELSDGTTVCLFCGKDMQNDVDFPIAENSQTYTPQKPKKKGKVTAIIISILAIATGRLIGGFIGETTGNLFMERSAINDINDYIESTETYTPGYRNGNEYVSEKFGFCFAPDENWEYYSEEDLQTFSEGVKSNAIASGLKELENEDVSQELKDKFAESVYAATEMGALYISDEMYVGDVTVGVLSAYGAESMSVEEYVAGIKKGFNVDNVQITDESLAGNLYKTLIAPIDLNGVKTTVKMFVRIEGNMICMITCKAMEGYEEQVFKAFNESISAY